VSDEDGTAILVSQAVKGDAVAFETLIAPVLPAAYRLATTMLGDRNAAEDAVQEAALKAWQKMNRFRASEALQPWFLGITANECRTARRSRWWRLLPLPDFEGSGSAASPEDEWTSRLDLERALDHLPKHHLLALTLYYHLDLPINEVAAVLGCSVGAAKVRVHRALKALQPAVRAEVMP
jgi:RNA polymerase sigma-70 factor (ECF subfamily)